MYFTKDSQCIAFPLLSAMKTRKIHGFIYGYDKIIQKLDRVISNIRDNLTKDLS